jgi:hypothetical protein
MQNARVMVSKSINKQSKAEFNRRKSMDFPAWPLSVHQEQPERLDYPGLIPDVVFSYRSFYQQTRVLYAAPKRALRQSNAVKIVSSTMKDKVNALLSVSPLRSGIEFWLLPSEVSSWQ